ncbi:MAG: DUF2442 domain-containing protein [Chloroflexi bacterium]|nr:DUF2442 domain-containing protein [Chloroflexota bacterium]MBI4332988.1 DUF2442 domain-containing protein [Chloroflexota bacterium]
MVRVISAEPAENHKLRIMLSNSKRGIFDVSPYLDKGVFRELRDRQYFRLVRVAYGGVMWPHEQDFSAETIELELQEDEARAKNCGTSSLLSGSGSPGLGAGKSPQSPFDKGGGQIPLSPSLAKGGGTRLPFTTLFVSAQRRESGTQ